MKNVFGGPNMPFKTKSGLTGTIKDNVFKLDKESQERLMMENIKRLQEAP
jgi:hypothetical protein